MSVEKFPSPAHASNPDAYWMARVPPEDVHAVPAVILGRRERTVLEIDPVIGERILRLLKGVRDGVFRQMAYRCHDVTEHAFGELGTFRQLRLVPPRGEILLGPEPALRKFGAPCGFQFQNAADRTGPAFHSGVLLGMDGGLSNDLPPSERAIVVHKPGTYELEIVTLASAVARYADKLQDIAYFGQHE